MTNSLSHTKPKLTTRHLVFVALFVALTAVGAKIEIPLPYVPFTLQTFFVLLSGMVLGSRLGALSQIVYLAVGLIGIPVFARGGGVGYVLQPTFGYILGFIPAAYIVGMLIEKRSRVNFPHFLVASFCGLVVVYLFGLMYLWLCTNFFLGKNLSFIQTLKIGLIVLMPGAIAKSFLAAIVGSDLRKRLI